MGFDEGDTLEAHSKFSVMVEDLKHKRQRTAFEEKDEFIYNEGPIVEGSDKITKHPKQDNAFWHVVLTDEKTHNAAQKESRRRMSCRHKHVSYVSSIGLLSVCVVLASLM